MNILRNNLIKKICSDANIGKFLKTERIDEGGNNQAFKLFTETNSYLLKKYFYSEEDTRDRLGNEFSFSNYAYDNNIREIAQPIYSNKKEKIAVFEFINGTKIKKVEKEHINSAMNFIVRLNKHRLSETGKNLPLASEAVFSIDKHIELIENRIKKLEQLENEAELHIFLNNQLKPYWEKAKQKALSYDLELSNEDICISPSDFGFHNALIDENKNIFFIDFEYAGRCDPAKLISDFFCQPEVPINLKYRNLFIDTLSPIFTEKLHLKERVDALYCLFRTKWVCIILNEFLKTGKERRLFANSNNSIKLKQKEQLAKAKQYLKELACADPAQNSISNK